MRNWWRNYPGSLNWANKKKLSANIKQLEKNIQQIKKNLMLLLALTSKWESHCKELTESSGRQQLTAKHLVELKPLLETSVRFHHVLDHLYKEEMDTSGEQKSANSDLEFRA
jgi:hypothetical protein